MSFPSRALDEDAQPIIAINRTRRVDRALDELIGFIRGLLADDHLCVKEVDALAQWTVTNREIAHLWPLNVVVQRLNRIYADDIVEDDEREGLKEFLKEFIGQHSVEPFRAASSELPLCRPAPEVIFDRSVFVFTGKFLYGPRRVCERETMVRGGLCQDGITLKCNYVVVGSVGSRDWVHSSWGRKIEKAVEYKPLCNLAIIGEEHWANYLMGLPDGPAR